MIPPLIETLGPKSTLFPIDIELTDAIKTAPGPICTSSPTEIVLNVKIEFSGEK